ncbi:MAG TPA: hypothetical protein VMV92_19665 [Streptosporangiaceae bacterium]|nr:hypothetical protein [Streptosporangiaceae bacterium]
MSSTARASPATCSRGTIGDVTVLTADEDIRAAERAALHDLPGRARPRVSTAGMDKTRG